MKPETLKSWIYSALKQEDMEGLHFLAPHLNTLHFNEKSPKSLLRHIREIFSTNPDKAAIIPYLEFFNSFGVELQKDSDAFRWLFLNYSYGASFLQWEAKPCYDHHFLWESLFYKYPSFNMTENHKIRAETWMSLLKNVDAQYLNQQDKEGNTIGHHLLATDFPDFYRSPLFYRPNDWLTVFSFLLDKGINLQLANHQGETLQNAFNNTHNLEKIQTYISTLQESDPAKAFLVGKISTQIQAMDLHQSTLLTETHRSKHLPRL